MSSTILTQFRKQPQPVKHKVRYAKAMTVCIAVACLEDKEPRIALCSDTRLDYQEQGSTNMTPKVDVLGHGWCIQLAGHWSGVQEWSRILKKRVQKRQGSIDFPTMVGDCQWSLSQFVKSPLYWSEQGYQILVSGFDTEGPAIIKSGVFPQEIKSEANREFGAIGEGEAMALTILRQRECHPRLKLQYGAYLAYEAKRVSEKCGSVGAITTTLIQAPLHPDDPAKASLNYLSEAGAAGFDGLYRRFWRVPFDSLVTMPEIPSEFFIDLAKKQAPE